MQSKRSLSAVARQFPLIGISYCAGRRILRLPVQAVTFDISTVIRRVGRLADLRVQSSVTHDFFVPIKPLYLDDLRVAISTE